MFRKTVALLLCFSIISCSSVPSTTAISNEAKKNEQFKGEIVGEFLITEDGNKLVIIGNKHHFVFPLNKNLREILLWQGRKNLSASFDNLDQTAENSVSVNFMIFANNYLEDDKKFLSSHQFQEKINRAYVSKPFMKLEGVMHGNFYLANGVKYEGTTKFNRPYYIAYKGANSINTAGESPLAKAGGTIAILGILLVAIPLIPIINITGQCNGGWCQNY